MWVLGKTKHAARGGFDGDVVRATVAFDANFSTLNACACPTLGAARMVVKKRQLL